jgi:type I restriction enzyme S subunit
MTTPWPMVKLGNVLKRANRFEPKNELTEYQFAGTYSFGKGIFVGERKFGASFGLDKVQRIHAEDFVYCKIMAWEGAFGLVPPAADDCVLSGAFVCYTVDTDAVDPKFLEY